MAHTVTVTGATGNVGNRLAERLLERGVRVRAVGRSEDRLAGLVGRGAEARAGDLSDTTFLTEALRGSDAAFVMVPPNYAAVDYRAYERSVAQSFADALREAAVPRAVALSSLGADLAEGTGPIAGLHDMEELLAGVPGLSLVALRPTFFMENFLGSIQLIKSAGVNGGTVAGDAPVPLVATRDIADVAAGYLAEPAFEGREVRELLGPRDLTNRQATAILGAAIGKPDLAYVEISEDVYRQELIGAGFSESAADAMLEMSRALGEGRIRSLTGRDERSATPTTFEEFARDVFAPAYRAG